jgi:hypothetical protein
MKRVLRVAGIASLLWFALAPHGTVAGPAPEKSTTEDPAPLYLYYLHGAIIEEKGIRPVSEQWGVYEYEKILDAFREKGFIVDSEARPSGTDPVRYARKLAERIRASIESGVSPQRITVVGASKGAIIAMLTSTYLKEQEVGFVTIAACNDWVFANIDFDLHGRILSIYEESDVRNGSCRDEYFRRSHGISRFEEIKVSTGLGHGVLYRPIDEWVGPSVDWARAPLLSTP